MIEERSRGPPYVILLAIVVILVIGFPMFLGDGSEALTEFITDLLSPLGLLLLPIILLLLIQYLSSDAGSFVSTIFSSGEPNFISGSPVGVALVLLLVLFLMYSKFSIFGGDGDLEE